MSDLQVERRLQSWSAACVLPDSTVAVQRWVGNCADIEHVACHQCIVLAEAEGQARFTTQWLHLRLKRHCAAARLPPLPVHQRAQVVVRSSFLHHHCNRTHTLDSVPDWRA